MDKSISVLVVEDSQTVSLILTRQLQNLGYSDIDVASDGQAALDRVSQKQYSLVLSDWEMQPMGGEAFLKALRQKTRVPVILTTAKTSRGTAWLSGADAYLAKPFTEKDLESAIKTVLK